MEVRVDKIIKIVLQEKETNRLISLLDDYSKSETDEMHKFRTDLQDYLKMACK